METPEFRVVKAGLVYFQDIGNDTLACEFPGILLNDIIVGKVIG